MVAAAGIGSGLDIDGLVTQLVAAERSPSESRLIRQESRLTNELSAFGALQGSLNVVKDALARLTQSSTFNSRTAISSDTSAVGVSANGDAEPGSYNLEVQQLAQTQSLASGSFSELTDTIGEGVLTFRFGTASLTPPEGAGQSFDSFAVDAESQSVSITVDSSNNTIQGLRDAINDADMGVTATIVNDGSGYRLLMSTNETGAGKAMEIQVEDTGDANDTDNAGLSRLAFNTTANNMTQTVTAQDALFTVNGLEISSATNDIEGAIEGVSLDLKTATESPVNVTIDKNRASVRGAVDGFIAAYNSFVSVTNNLTAYNADSGSAGALQGDFSTRAIINQVRNALGADASGVGEALSSLSELGVRTNVDGTVSLDAEQFDAAIDDDFESIEALFSEVGNPSDSNISFLRSSDATQVGDYAVNVTQLATKASLTGAAMTPPSVGSPLVIDDDNDELTLTINGVESDTISVTQGSYESGADFAAELQSKINSDAELSAAGASVTVSFNESNELVISAAEYGSAGSIEINTVDTTSTASFGLSVASGTAGLDVEGSIGGVAAVGSGQSLSAAAGSDAEGIVLSVAGGVVGDRGSVRFSQGIAVAMTSLLDGFLDDDGILESRRDGIQTTVDRIADDRETLDLRMEALEARFRRQFNALDTLLANLQNTSSFLAQALENLPTPGQSSRN